MSRRNSHFQKAIRREQREADKERSQFIHEASREFPVSHKSRKARRNGR